MFDWFPNGLIPSNARPIFKSWIFVANLSHVEFIWTQGNMQHVVHIHPSFYRHGVTSWALKDWEFWTSFSIVELVENVSKISLVPCCTQGHIEIHHKLDIGLLPHVHFNTTHTHSDMHELKCNLNLGFELGFLLHNVILANCLILG